MKSKIIKAKETNYHQFTEGEAYINIEGNTVVVMKGIMLATVKYQVATYSGEVQVNCNENDEDKHIIAKAKRIVTQKAGGSLPFGYESWKVVKRS